MFCYLQTEFAATKSSNEILPVDTVIVGQHINSTEEFTALSSLPVLLR